MSSHGPRGFLVTAHALGARAPSAIRAVIVASLAGCAQSATPPPQNAGAAAPAAAVVAPPSPSPTPPGPPAGPGLRLISSVEARPWLLASVSIPSVDRTLSGATALLSRAVPLPLDAAGVKEMLLTQAGLPPKVGENLDTASPAGAVVVAVGGKEIAGLVIAMPAKGVEQARAVIGALGRVVSRRGEVMQVDNGSGGRGWVWQSANVIVLSDSVDALARGAMLALDARRAAGGEDLTATLYPESIARANGTDLKSALAVAVATARAAQAPAPAKDGRASKNKAGAGGDRSTVPAAPPAAAAAAGGEVDHSLDVLEDVAAYLGDTNTLELGLSMDDAHGLVASLRVHPLPGTPFEALTTEGRPFVIDPSLLRRTEDVAFVFASSYGPFFRSQVDRQRKRLAESHEKGAAAALQFFDVSMAALEGSWSGIGELQPSPSLQLIYPLKDEASAAKLEAAMAHFDTAAALAVWRTQVGLAQQGLIDWKLKKETAGKIKALHYILSFDTKALPVKRDALKKLFGGTMLDVYAGVVGTRLLVTAGKNAKAKLIELARDDKHEDKAAGGKSSGAPSRMVVGPNGDLADALVAVKGKDSFGYFDLGQLVGLIGTLADEPRAQALAAGVSAPIPTYVTFGTDAQAKLLTFTWTVTPAAFAGAGALLQGMGGSGPTK